MMDKKFGLYIVAGLAMGAIYGIFFSPATDNGLLAIALGALAGLFLGWFVAIIVQQREKRDKR
jgi:membrane associated rhomboid family serine protease